MFDVEKLAVEYCEQYGIDEADPRRFDVITAFCVGAKVARNKCASIAYEFNTFPCGLESVGKRISLKILGKDDD